MPRFNTPANPVAEPFADSSQRKHPPITGKTRVCVYCDPELYRNLKGILAMQGETVTSWFEKYAGMEVGHAKAFCAAFDKSRATKLTPV